MWDERFSEPGFAYGTEPNDFLVSVADRIPRGKVLCLAEGEGRNAVYLARRRVHQRLRQLGASYREDGRLTEQLKQALASRPSPRVQRLVTERIENTMLLRQESSR